MIEEKIKKIVKKLIDELKDPKSENLRIIIKELDEYYVERKNEKEKV